MNCRRCALHAEAEACRWLLVECGADPNTSHAQGLGGETALHLAAALGATGVCQALLADVRTETDAEDDAGDTPLHAAAKAGWAACVRALIAGGGGGPPLLILALLVARASLPPAPPSAPAVLPTAARP